MVEQDQKFSFRGPRILNHGGQAVVEYTLLLVVTVSVIFGAKKAFNSLDKFMNSYIADYTICLMKYGELPTLGITDSDLKKHIGAVGCDSKFAGFTFASGRPPLGSAGSGGGKSGLASGNNKNSTAGADKTDNDKRQSNGKASTGNKRGSGYGARSSAYGNGLIDRSNNYGTADGDTNSANKKTKVIEDEAEDKDVSRNRRGSDISSKRVNKPKLKYRTITGVEAEKIAKLTPKQLRAPVRIQAANEVGTENRFGPYKKTFTPPDIKPTAIKPEEESAFAFGNIFRWLIIGAMVIAIIVFFGGQIMNYSNSEER